MRLPCVTRASPAASSVSDNAASSVAEEGGRGRLRLRLTWTRPAPAHLKHTTVLVVVVVVVVVADTVVAAVDDTGGAELEAIGTGCSSGFLRQEVVRSSLAASAGKKAKGAQSCPGLCTMRVFV